MSEQLPDDSEFSEITEARTALRDFVHEITESVARNVQALHRPIERLSDEERVQFFMRLTSYAEFELLSDERLYDLPVCVTGGGLIMAFDTDGEIVGVEMVSEGDMVVGQIDDAIAQPTLSYADIVRQMEDGMPCDAEVASSVLILRDAAFLSDLEPSGRYGYERDLSEFRIGIPLVYPLHVDVDEESF